MTESKKKPKKNNAENDEWAILAWECVDNPTDAGATAILSPHGKYYKPKGE